MTFLTQTRTNTGNGQYERENPLPTVIACLMGLSDPEAVFQVQEQYDRDQPDDSGNWVNQLQAWLQARRWSLHLLTGHQNDKQPYLVIGQSPRGINHVCVYQAGKLLHDPYPTGKGLVTEEVFVYVTPTNAIA